MRKLIVLLIIPLLTGCAYQQASTASNQVYLGMPILEFKKVTGRKAKLEAMEYGFTVYKMHDYDPWTAVIIDTKFFYFDSSAKLYKIDGGQFKQQRYQIEIINK